MKPVTLTAELVESFAGIYLSPRYDHAVPTPDFHREAWALYVSPAPAAGCIAPREHAKSTALTFVFGLAEVCFRVSDYVIIIGSTEDMAAEQLSNLREELLDNEDLRRDFDIGEFEQDSKTDIIVRCTDGHRFRILARGAEQKIRGKMWKGKRPNLIIGDDMEDDEQVENIDRRRKFRRWLFRAARQALGRYGRIRIHGTILHEDAVLARLRKNSGWKMLFYKAHAAFSDFSEILWPEGWDEKRLKLRRQEFIDDGDSAGYSQEFLNDPRDNAEAFLRKTDFLPMLESDRDAEKIFAVGWDFAVSKSDRANKTAAVVGGKDARNFISIVDCRPGRWNSLEIVDKMFDLERDYSPVAHFVEDGAIWKAIGPMIQKEMGRRDRWLNIVPIPSIKDKKSRASPLQKHHRAQGMRFDMEAAWWPEYEDIMLRFTGDSDALHDDEFDATALLVKGFENLADVAEEDFDDEDEAEMRHATPRRFGQQDGGRSRVTGY